MATGTTADLLARLRANLPPWFPNQGSAPVLDGLLTGIASALAFAYSLYTFAASQTRLKTLSGAFIDLAAWDYFGSSYLRIPGEIDSSFLPRFLAAILAPKVTSAAIQAALVTLTGNPVRVIEAWLPSDVGMIDGMYLDVDVPAAPGRIGSPGLACQFFVECALPLTQPFGNNAMPAIDVNLYIDTPPTGYIMDIPTSTPQGAAVVYAAVNAIRAAGVICWLRFVPIATAVTWDQPGAKWDAPGVVWDR